LLNNKPALVEADRQLSDLLFQIDTLVLAAYDLPPRLEGDLLAYFGAAKRPVGHDWSNWNDQYPAPGLTLAERLSGSFRPQKRWISELFKPLPPEEAELLRIFGV